MDNQPGGTSDDNIDFRGMLLGRIEVCTAADLLPELAVAPSTPVYSDGRWAAGRDIAPRILSKS